MSILFSIFHLDPQICTDHFVKRKELHLLHLGQCACFLIIRWWLSWDMYNGNQTYISFVCMWLRKMIIDALHLFPKYGICPRIIPLTYFIQGNIFLAQHSTIANTFILKSTLLEALSSPIVIYSMNYSDFRVNLFEFFLTTINVFCDFEYVKVLIFFITAICCCNWPQLMRGVIKCTIRIQDILLMWWFSFSIYKKKIFEGVVL